MKNRPPRFLFGLPCLLRISKFRDPPVYLGPPVYSAGESIPLNVQITFLDFRAQNNLGPQKKFRIPIFADLRPAIEKK